MLESEDDAPGFDNFVGVGGSERDQAGNAAQRYELLDRLVCGSILANADRIVREHEDDWKLHQGAKSDGWFHIVGKDEETCAKGADLGHGEPVQHRTHSVLADAEMHIAAARCFSLKIAGALE